MGIITFIILVLFAFMLFGAIFKGKDETYAKGISKGCGTLIIPVTVIVLLVIIIAIYIIKTKLGLFFD